jgi:hypothetical protein
VSEIVTWTERSYSSVLNAEVRKSSVEGILCLANYGPRIETTRANSQQLVS